MKKFIFPVLTCMFVSFAVHAQNKVGIGNTSPEAELDVTGEIRGTTFQMTSGAAMGSILSSDATGNATWVMPSTILSNEWHATGNSGTIPGIHFIGTIDNVDLFFRANNQTSGLIGLGNQLAFFGYQAGLNNSDGIRNSALGHQALFSNTEGINNTATGSQALYSNTTGINNTATGSQALYSNTSGDLNAAFGNDAMNANTTGSDNSAFGVGALYSNTTGGGNTAIGRAALYDNSTGSQNSAFGWDALHSNTTGHSNTATGSKTLYSNTTGAKNTAMGYQALFSNSTADNNVAFGFEALALNTTGSNNSAIGFQALYFNTTGYENTAYGEQALFHNTTGFFNTALGFKALYNNNSSGNTGIGYEALHFNTSGMQNSAVGYEALYSNTTGQGNTALGFQALSHNTEGLFNTALGWEALAEGELSQSNTAVGYGSLRFNVTGNYNSALGKEALWDNQGDRNTSFGYAAGRENESGSGNVFIGHQAGYNETGSDKLYIANNNTNPPLIYGVFPSNGISIGALITASESKLTLGRMNQPDEGGQLQLNPGSAWSKAYFADVWQDNLRIMDGTTTGSSNVRLVINNTGNVGIGVSAPATKLDVAGTTRTSGLQVGNLGTVFNKVQSGTFPVGAGVPGVNVYTIAFPHAFSGPPTIMVTARGENYTDTFSVTTRNITGIAFDVNVVRTDSPGGLWGQNLKIDWFAWE